MLKCNWCDYSNVYTLVKGDITVNNSAADGIAAKKY